MKLKFFLVFLVVLVGLALFGYFQSLETKVGNDNKVFSPKIIVTPESWDFGQVKKPSVVEHQFTVRNAGGEMLKISRISTSCGCTTASLDEQEIAPAKSAVLTVRYDSGAMAHEKGEIERVVYLKSNDPEKPQTEIIVTAQVP